MICSMRGLSTKITKFGSIRRLFSEKVAITLKDVEIIKNPGNDHVDSFLKNIETNKGEVNRNEFKLLRETMGDNYSLFFLCLKDSNDVVCASQSITYKSINGLADFQSWGLVVNPSKHCGNEMIEYLVKNMSEELGAVKMNSGGCTEPALSSMWHKYLQTKVRGVNYYVSHYNAKDIINPNLEYENINVKSFDGNTIKDITQYDQSIFPYERSKYIAAKFNNGIGRIATDNNGKVIGIGLAMTYSNGDCVLGPMYCDNKDVARAIFQSIINELPIKDLNKLQIRCSNHIEDSAKWATPFLRRPHEMTLHSFVKFNRIIPLGVDYSKIFVNSNPTNSPC